MLGKKKKDGSAEAALEVVLKEAFETLPATQRWVSLTDLRNAARVIDDDKKRPKR